MCVCCVGCWIPMVHVGPLRNFLVPDVVPPLPGTPSPSCSSGLHQGLSVLALFISLGTKFHASTTLFEKKFLFVSSLEACCFRFSGSEALLVVLTVTSTLWNHVLLATLSCPCIILNVWTISAWWRRSSRVVRPSSFNLSSYVDPCRPETMATARRRIFSRVALSASSQWTMYIS